MLYFVILVVGLFVQPSIMEPSEPRNTATRAPSLIHSSRKPSSPSNIDDTDYWDYDDFVPYKEDRHDMFDWKLFKEVLLSDNKNVVMSPFSVKILLSLLSEGAGAESKTKMELSSIFPNLNSHKLTREFYRNILDSLKKKNENYELHVGSKIFVDSFITPRQRFASIASAHYGAEIERLDFKDSQFSASLVNGWVSNITNGHIPKLVTRDDLENSVVLLLNAIYFDGTWRRPFVEENSFEFVFYVQPTKEIKAKYMTQISNFYFFESTKFNAKIIRLPYRGKKFAMTIILPGAKGGLDELIRDLEGDGLKRLQWLMDEKEVKVTLPKFRFEYTSHLKESLEKLGISEIFSDSASLPGFARGAGLQSQLRVSNIIQKCGLIVHEKGTTAYGATDILLSNKFGDNTPYEFNADRPFLFFIEDETTGNILFVGKVLDPTK